MVWMKNRNFATRWALWSNLEAQIGRMSLDCFAEWKTQKNDASVYDSLVILIHTESFAKYIAKSRRSNELGKKNWRNKVFFLKRTCVVDLWEILMEKTIVGGIYFDFAVIIWELFANRSHSRVRDKKTFRAGRGRHDDWNTKKRRQQSCTRIFISRKKNLIFERFIFFLGWIRIIREFCRSYLLLTTGCTLATDSHLCLEFLQLFGIHFDR